MHEVAALVHGALQRGLPTLHAALEALSAA